MAYDKIFITDWNLRNIWAPELSGRDIEKLKGSLILAVYSGKEVKASKNAEDVLKQLEVINIKPEGITVMDSLLQALGYYKAEDTQLWVIGKDDIAKEFVNRFGTLGIKSVGVSESLTLKKRKVLKMKETTDNEIISEDDLVTDREKQLEARRNQKRYEKQDKKTENKNPGFDHSEIKKSEKQNDFMIFRERIFADHTEMEKPVIEHTEIENAAGKLGFLYLRRFIRHCLYFIPNMDKTDISDDDYMDLIYLFSEAQDQDELIKTWQDKSKFLIRWKENKDSSVDPYRVLKTESDFLYMFWHLLYEEDPGTFEI